MTGGRWWRRLAGGALAFVCLEVVLSAAEAGPDALRLALLVATCVAVLGLVLDTLSDPGPSWALEADQPLSRVAGDPRLARLVGVLEGHLSARADDTALRERLGVLADQVLRQRHGITVTDPRAAELLGEELLAVLAGPPRRLGPSEIDRCLTRIKEL